MRVGGRGRGCVVAGSAEGRYGRPVWCGVGWVRAAARGGGQPTCTARVEVATKALSSPMLEASAAAPVTCSRVSNRDPTPQ